MQIYLHITFNDLYIRRLTFVYIPKSIYIIHKYTLYIFVVEDRIKIVVLTF